MESSWSAALVLALTPCSGGVPYGALLPGVRSGATASAPTHVGREGRDDARAEVVEALEDLARTCRRERNYGARDRVYERLLVLEPDHRKARRTLRYHRVRGEGWVQSDQYRPGTDHDPEALAELPSALEEAVRPYASVLLARLGEAAEAGSSTTARPLAEELDALLPDAGALRVELEAVWDTARGRLAATEEAEADATEEETEPLEGDPAPPRLELEEHPLTLDLARFDLPWVVDPELGDAEGRWRARLGASEVEMALYVFDLGLWFPAEPEDAPEHFLSSWREPGGVRWPGYHYGSIERIEDGAGAAEYAALMRGELRPSIDVDDDEGPGGAWVLGGCLEDAAWAVAVQCRPALAEDDALRFAEALRAAVDYSGPKRDPRWTDEEAWARWREHAPEDAVDDMEEIVRTDHFIVLGNSDSGKRFAEAMEECYERVREIYPFEDRPGQRLLPVFLFRTRDQYNRYYASVANTTVGRAARSGGHAWRDYYASWYEAPKDPVHVHEVTHQLFKNRLRLWGGGSWYQEGAAEYVETRENQRGGAARAVRKGDHDPLEEFVTIPSLLQSTGRSIKGGNPAGDRYKVAAVLFEFLMESDWGRDGFPEFLRRVGRVPRGDRERIEAAVREVYGTDLAGMEEAWIEYCERR